MEILFIDACVRAESRTRALANTLLGNLDGNITHLKLWETELPEIDEIAIKNRNIDGKNNRFDAPVYDLAKQFAAADCIVIAAPFWDLSFPAVLKKYIEAITVSGITFRYSEQGIPIGMCRAEKLLYVTTAGGPIFNDEFGYGYIKTMAQQMYGIGDCVCFKAENLDIIGADVESIIKTAEKQIADYFNK